MNSMEAALIKSLLSKKTGFEFHSVCVFPKHDSTFLTPHLYVMAIHLNADFTILSTIVTDDLTDNVSQQRLPKKTISHLTKLVLNFIERVLALISFILPRLRRSLVLKHSLKRTENGLRTELEVRSSQEKCLPPFIENEPLHPCWQRLQHLEMLVTELVKKPAQIPPEKENMILESLSRIKSIESDLQKTKRVRYLVSLRVLVF